MAHEKETELYTCHKCGHNKSIFRSKQMRRGDEQKGGVIHCTKCHTERTIG